ncbi:hypothetical protein [Brevundimonas sp.]|nr:hypothetical protein [Brevundimonas sp.]
MRLLRRYRSLRGSLHLLLIVLSGTPAREGGRLPDVPHRRRRAGDPLARA